MERLVAWYQVGSSYGAVAALIIANLVPLVGVLWFGWDVWGILIIYWLENGIVRALQRPQDAARRGVGRQLTDGGSRHPTTAQ